MFLVVGQVYVHVAAIWAACGASYNKKSRAQLAKAVTDAMADGANGGSGGGECVGGSECESECMRLYVYPRIWIHFLPYTS